MTLEVLSEHCVFGSTQGFYQHDSEACAGPMCFGLYRPPSKSVGVLYCLAGLTCTE